MSILEYNGGVVLAMTGKNCVAIASDLRFGIKNQSISYNCPKTHQMGPRLFVGLTGLISDQQTLLELFKFRWNLFALKEERPMPPEQFANFVSSTLYEKRFGPYFVEPVIAGLKGKNNDEPFLCSMDLLGASMISDDFAVAGTCTEALYGMCETYWRADLEEDELFEIVSQCLMSAVDRDALSGWGAEVHIISKDKIVTRRIKARMD
eukprot:TRINITY_DN2450_c0_g1_i1.p2 TRINITY_DN2450_c0_g1~~TRINITY_DN2450_c0_g1_i1.p2  ORF type:complete len:223 (-),score=93.67 TRINITY_DN2450_c0_g1_i1:104-724(-)